MQSTNHSAPVWSSRFAFYLSSVGAAVGLGSIWRFPYLAGTNGGSAFIFVFVLACLLIATPLLAAEFLLGRRSGESPPAAAGAVAAMSGRSSWWNAIGILGTLAAFLILSYYAVIAGWVTAYTWKCASGQLVGLNHDQVAGLWHGFLANPWELGAWQTAFLGLVTFISAKGVNYGIEVANKIRAPSLLLLLLILVAYSLSTGDVARGLSFAFAPNFSAITPKVVLAAIGQAFFATGVGMAMMIAYGAYVARGTSLVRSSLIISGSILLASMLSTLMIFPLVFHYGMNPAQGSELVFDVLPTVFSEMPGGRIIGSLFFLMLIFAALTPSLASLEPTVAWVQRKFNLSRARAAVISGVACWVLGWGSVLSFNVLSEWRPLGALPLFRNMTLFDVVDYISANIMLPVGAFLTSLFIGWLINREIVSQELAETTPAARRWLVWLLQYLCPAAIAAVAITLLT